MRTTCASHTGPPCWGQTSRGSRESHFRFCPAAAALRRSRDHLSSCRRCWWRRRLRRLSRQMMMNAEVDVSDERSSSSNTDSSDSADRARRRDGGTTTTRRTLAGVERQETRSEEDRRQCELAARPAGTPLYAVRSDEDR